jgi:hypothetical protein
VRPLPRTARPTDSHACVRVFVEDLAVTMLINSRVDAKQAMGVARNQTTLDLSVLPDKALGETTDHERQTMAELIGAMTTWPGIGASVASETLHKKRPALIPVLDNMAIFGGPSTRHRRGNPSRRASPRSRRDGRDIDHEVCAVADCTRGRRIRDLGGLRA